MADPFYTFRPGLDSPAVSASAITAGASEIDPLPRAIYVGGSGDITVEMPDGTTATFTGLVGGNIYPIRALKVTAATATGLIGLS